MKKILLTAVILVVVSCKKDKETVSEIQTNTDSTIIQQNSAAKIQDSGSVAALQLDKFGFPPEVEGCSCYFAENKADFEAEKYVYIDDYGNNAYIKVKGQLIKIPMEEGDFDPSNFQKAIENDNYKVLMKGQKIKEMDEVMMFTGEMTVEDKKTGEKTTTPIYGECGC